MSEDLPNQEVNPSSELAIACTPPDGVQLVKSTKLRNWTRVQAWVLGNPIKVFLGVLFGFSVVTNILGLSSLPSLLVVSGGLAGTMKLVFSSGGTDAEEINGPLLQLETYGDYDLAIECLRKSAFESEKVFDRLYHVHNWAYVARRMGDLSLALELFLEIQRLHMPTLDKSIRSNLAFIYALLGDTERVTEYLSDPPYLIGASHAVGWSRTEKWSKVKDFISTSPIKRMRPIYRHEFRILSLMKAFACSATDDLKGCEKYLGGARQAHFGEYDYLTSKWPELKTFLAVHEEDLIPKEQKKQPLPKAQLRSP